MSSDFGWIDGIKNIFASNKSNPVSIEGFPFAMTAKVDTHKLCLNGTGTRLKAGEKLYAIGLYLPSKAHREDTAKALLGPRRVHIVALSSLDATSLIDSLRDGITENTSPTAQGFIVEELRQLEAIMGELTAISRGDAIDFDWIPGRGAFVYYNGRLLSNPVRGKALYDAVLSIWLGENSLDKEIREGLLDSKH